MMPTSHQRLEMMRRPGFQVADRLEGHLESALADQLRELFAALDGLLRKFRETFGQALHLEIAGRVLAVPVDGIQEGARRILVAHAGGIDFQRRAGDRQPFAVGIDPPGVVGNFAVQRGGIEIGAVDEAELVVVELAGGVAMHRPGAETCADRLHHFFLRDIVEAIAQFGDIAHVEHRELEVLTGLLRVEDHLAGDGRKRFPVQHVAADDPRQVVLVALRANGRYPERQVELAAELAHLKAAQAERQRHAGLACQLDMNVVDALAARGISEKPVEKRTRRIGNIVAQARADEIGRRASDEGRGRPGSENDLARLVEFEQQVGIAECQRDEAVAFDAQTGRLRSGAGNIYLARQGLTQRHDLASVFDDARMSARAVTGVLSVLAR